MQLAPNLLGLFPPARLRQTPSASSRPVKFGPPELAHAPVSVRPWPGICAP